MRFERKYRIEGKPEATVRQLLRFHPASFRPLFPDRQVNNVYFDTPDLQSFHQNVAGKNERKKYRVRWYGENLQYIQQAKLEIKSKHNELGEKESFPFEAVQLKDLRTLSHQVHQLLGPSVHLHPILLNSYLRSYWISRDKRFRITIDHEMRYHSLVTTPRFRSYQIGDLAVVVEVKYEEADDAFATFITQHMPFRQAKHSKYVQGVQLTIQ